MRNALLQAILDNPEDNLARLAYADWCEENGDVERGEFIRVQLEIARRLEMAKKRFLVLPEDQEGRCIQALVDHQDRLLRTWQRRPPEYTGDHDARVYARYAWAGAVANLPDPNLAGWTFTRGFVSELRCMKELFLSVAVPIFSAHPIEQVFLQGAYPLDNSTWGRDDTRSSVGDVRYDTVWSLPRVIWDALEDYDRLTVGSFVTDGPNNKHYKDRFCAYNALSRACVKVGRRMAREAREP
jgi:uncharacterized protein (TIGR02996 family)